LGPVLSYLAENLTIRQQGFPFKMRHINRAYRSALKSCFKNFQIGISLRTTKTVTLINDPNKL
jgi:ribosomal protein S20